ncbi:MAG: bacteriocin [Nitrobacter sp.]|jgi:bacteriocin-like protein
MSNPNGDVRELTTSELNAVSGGEGVMQGTKIKITMDKGTLDISYVSTNGGTPLPYAHWTPK